MKKCRSFGPSERLPSLLNSGILNCTPSGVFPSSKAIAIALQLVHFPHASPSSSLCFAKADPIAAYMLRWQQWDEPHSLFPALRLAFHKQRCKRCYTCNQNQDACGTDFDLGLAEGNRTAPIGSVLYCLPFFVSNTMVRIGAYYFWTCLNIDETTAMPRRMDNFVSIMIW
ncbi:hypothetical protein EJC50_11110 [Paenibacillus albus]|uniref:Uncharacterized protein n=1 Tax=Paenibacillus albus TaxID=2495582 RepID=A0A3Q8X4F5_9BACL|nr:hypothetical protein EJC50_11110 [Paenibacillus albus]